MPFLHTGCQVCICRDIEKERLLNLLEVGVEPRARSEIDELINHDAELIGGLASA